MDNFDDSTKDEYDDTDEVDTDEPVDDLDDIDDVEENDDSSEEEDLGTDKDIFSLVVLQHSRALLAEGDEGLKVGPDLLSELVLV